MIFYTGDKFPQWKGNIFVGGLSGLALHRLAFNEKGGLLGREALLTELRQRIRDVRQGPDGNIYVAVDANPGGVLRIEPAKRARRQGVADRGANAGIDCSPTGRQKASFHGSDESLAAAKWRHFASCCWPVTC